MDELYSTAAVAVIPPAPPTPRQTPRQRLDCHLIRRLRSLPVPIFIQVTEKLEQGESLRSVTRWILAQPDRGGMSNVGFHTTLRYVGVYNEKLREIMRRRRIDLRANVHRLNQRIQREAADIENEAAALNRNPRNELIFDHQKPEQIIEQTLSWLSAKNLAAFTVAKLRMRIEMYDQMEQRMRMPIAHAIKDYELLLAACEILRKLEGQRALFAAKGMMLDDNVIEAQMAALPEGVGDDDLSSETDRLIMRSMAEKLARYRELGAQQVEAHGVIDSDETSSTP